MSFFGKHKGEDLDKDLLHGDKVPISSIVGTGMSFVGDVTFTGKLRLDGSVKGNVNGDHLILGETGTITGDVDIETFTCQGKVCGNIRAQNLNVVKGCRIDGNVEAVNLLVEGGASLNGEVKVETSDLRLVKGKSNEGKEEPAAVQATS